MKISALIMGFNEEENIPKLFEGIKGVDEILFLDHNSTDNTAKIAKDLGAKVITREFPYNLATDEDCKEFEKRFGFAPEFKAGDKMTKAGYERYSGGKLCKNDWILNIDCDEFVTWDIEKVKQKTEDADVISCKFIHEHNPDGSANVWFQIPKLYNRQKTWWIGRVHEALTGYNLKIVWTDDLVIDHWQREREYKRGYVALLEYAVFESEEARWFFYLGKEYFLYQQYEKTIQFLTLYLKQSVIVAEKVRAYIIIAAAMWELGREDEAWVYAMQALKLDPKSQETFIFLSKIASKKNQAQWLKYAEIAEDQHLV